MKEKLTIGMCTHDDFDGVWFTIQSIRMYHPEVLDRIRFVVVDSNSDKPHGLACERLISKLTNKHGQHALYVKNVTWKSTASRNYVFEFSKTPYVMCVDSHVMIAPGAIDRLIKYFDKNPTSKDILHGPLIGDNQELFATQMDPEWEYNMYGKWVRDMSKENLKEPYEVDMMGLGLFACVKDNWLGFNKDFTGFGGEEGYIHKKYRKNGGKALILPWLKWLHRFERPDGIPYNPEYIDRVKNYLYGWAELGETPEEIINYFSKPNDIKGQEREAFEKDYMYNIYKDYKSRLVEGDSKEVQITKIEEQIATLQAKLDSIMKQQ